MPDGLIGLFWATSSSALSFLYKSFQMPVDDFAMFAALNFSLGEKRQFLLTDLTNFSPSFLVQPLLLLDPKVIDMAMHANKLIINFMESQHFEEDGSRVMVDVVSDLLYNTMNQDLYELTDEIYCQLIKQTRNNPRRSALRRGLQLMLCCLLHRVPSDAVTTCLLSHCRKIIAASPSSSAASQLSHQAVLALTHMKKFGPRRIVSVKEIKYILLGEIPAAMYLNVLTTGGERISVEVDSWMTVESFKRVACEKIGIIGDEVDYLFLRAVLPAKKKAVLLPNAGHLLKLLHIHSSEDDNDQVLRGTSTQHQPQWRHPPPASGCPLDELLYIDVDHHGMNNVLTSPSVGSFDNNSIGGSPNSPTGQTQSAATSTSGRLRVGAVSLAKRFYDIMKPSASSSDNAMHSTTPLSSTTPCLQLELVVVVFPHGAPPPPCFSNPSSTNPSPREGTSSSSSTEGFRDRADRMNPSPRNNPNLRVSLGPTWPQQEPLRDLLFFQLARTLAKDEVVCSGDDEVLRLAALVCAHRHMTMYDTNAAAIMRRSFFRALEGGGSETGLVPGARTVVSFEEPEGSGRGMEGFEGSLTDDQRLDIVTADLDKLLPRSLLDKPMATNTPRCVLNQLDLLLYSPSSTEHKNDVVEEDRADRRQTGEGGSTGSNQPLSTWHAFLASSIARLWKHIDTMSAAECRDEFLKSIRHTFHYGVTTFRPSAVEMLPMQPEPDQGQESSGIADGSGSESIGAGASLHRRSPGTQHSHDSSSSGRGEGTPRTYYECQPRHSQGNSNSSAVRNAANMLDLPSSSAAEDILLTISCKGVALAIHLPSPPILPVTSAPVSTPAIASFDGLERGVRSDSSLSHEQEPGPSPSSSLDISQAISSHRSGQDVRRSVDTSPLSHPPFLALALASVPVPPPVLVDQPPTPHPRDVITTRTKGGGGHDIARVMLHLDWDDIMAWGYNSTSLRVQYSRRKTGGIKHDPGGSPITLDESPDSDFVTITTPDAQVIAEILKIYSKILCNP